MIESFGINENWMLDWAENDQSEGAAAQNIRVGLQAPGSADDPEGGLDPVQIVRFKINIKPRAGAQLAEIEDESFIVR